jgi:hypothetical protein
MAENTDRNVFGLHGVAGMLIATVLLLTILVVLTVMGIGTQQANAAKYYDPTPMTESLTNVKANSKDNAQHAFKDAN